MSTPTSVFSPPRRKSRRAGGATALALIAGVLVFAWAIVPRVRRIPRMISLSLREAPQHLPVPVAGVRRSALADTWGAARSGGRRHEGIDIFARRGTPVLSATDGVILRMGWNSLGGRSVTIYGPAGERHYYAHFDRYSRLEAGDAVEVGDTIGFVGTSGNAQGTPPHLHYGIYADRGAINPYPRLRSRR